MSVFAPTSSKIPNVKFAATALPEGKKGIITPDEKGYYRIIGGAFNAVNFSGITYLANEAVKLFEKNSTLMRRFQQGCVFSECEHPKPLPGQSDEEYFDRLRSHDRFRECGHIRTAELDFNFGKNNPQFNSPNMIGVWIEIKPKGQLGELLKQSLDNPDENVCFSIRSIIKQFMYQGKYYREVLEICTWDWVPEGGIFPARKWATPGLESHKHQSNRIRDKDLLNLTQDLILPSKDLLMPHKDVAIGLESSPDLILNSLQTKIYGNSFQEWK